MLGRKMAELRSRSHRNVNSHVNVAGEISHGVPPLEKKLMTVGNRRISIS